MNVLATRDQPTLADFGADVWWIVLIKIVGIFAILVAMTLFAIVFERKVVARMQQRIGPNRVGPRGYLQSLADGLKLAFKEDIMPALADKPVYFLAPIIATIPAFLGLLRSSHSARRSASSALHPLQLTDAPIGVFIVLACSAMGVYGIVLAGWASGSTYPLLGSLRSAAPDGQLRDRDGSVDRRGVPLRRHGLDLGDRRGAGRRQRAELLRPDVPPARAGSPCCCRSRSSSTRSRSSVRPTARPSTSRRPRASWSAVSTPSTRR